MDVIKDFGFGQLPDGSIQFSLEYADGTQRVGILNPELVGLLLSTLMHLVPQANDPAVKRHAQLLTIREVTGRVEHGVATLSYELEGSPARLTSTIPADSARALSRALAMASQDPTRH